MNKSILICLALALTGCSKAPTEQPVGKTQLRTDLATIRSTLDLDFELAKKLYRTEAWRSMTTQDLDELRTKEKKFRDLAPSFASSKVEGAQESCESLSKEFKWLLELADSKDSKSVAQTELNLLTEKGAKQAWELYETRIKLAEAQSR